MQSEGSTGLCGVSWYTSTALGLPPGAVLSQMSGSITGVALATGTACCLLGLGITDLDCSLESALQTPHKVTHSFPLTQSGMPKVLYCQCLAPWVDLFIEESSEFRFDDWLPSLKRAAEWNG